jgi:hypothetical protein
MVIRLKEIKKIEKELPSPFHFLDVICEMLGMGIFYEIRKT